MEIATHHTEGEGIISGIDVEIGLLFDRVGLKTRDVAERHFELSSLVIAHLADAAATFADEAAMPTGHAANPAGFGETQAPNDGMAIEDIGELWVRSGHSNRRGLQGRPRNPRVQVWLLPDHFNSTKNNSRVGGERKVLSALSPWNAGDLRASKALPIHSGIAILGPKAREPDHGADRPGDC